MHLFVTGEIGVGKTTLIKSLLKNIPNNKIYGFYTQKMALEERTEDTPKEAGKVYIFSAPYQESAATVHCVADIVEKEKIKLHLEEFEAYGVSLLEQIPEQSIVLMDELGFLESSAPKFCEKVLNLLDRNVCVIGAIKPKDTPFLNQIRAHKAVKLYTLTKENREELITQLLSHMPYGTTHMH